MVNEENIKNNVKVDYWELLELGFEKEYLDDPVHLSQYGYAYFVLSYGCEDDQVSMEWSPITREVNLYINSHLYQKCLTLDDVKNIIEMLNDDE